MYRYIRSSKDADFITLDRVIESRKFRLSSDRRHALADIFYDKPQGTQVQVGINTVYTKVDDTPGGVWVSNDGQHEFSEDILKSLAHYRITGGEVMKRYIKSDQYIPDMTERFPEGMRNYDETEPDGYEPDYAEWESEHYSDLVKEIRKYQDMTQEEFDALAEDDRQRYYDIEEELREYDDSDSSAWERQWEVPEVDDSIMITQGYVGDNFTGETVGSYGEFTYGGYWVHTSKNEAHFDSADEIDAYLEEKGLHKENRL